jgi:hypothetical protein
MQAMRHLALFPSSLTKLSGLRVSVVKSAKIKGIKPNTSRYKPKILCRDSHLKIGDRDAVTFIKKASGIFILKRPLILFKLRTVPLPVIP